MGNQQLTANGSQSRSWMYWTAGALLVLIVLLGVVAPGWLRHWRAAHDVAEISVALDLYRMTYGKYPLGTKADLCGILLGINIDRQNAREIQFLEAKPAEINQDGEFIDPWGSPYEIQVGDTVLIYSCGPNRIDDRGGHDDIKHDASGPAAR